MYDYIKGKYAGYYKDYAIIDNCGIGYKIYVPGSSLTRLPKINDEVLLYIHQIVREDFIGLYGFISRDELELFTMLLNINGVGAKAALSMLSIMDSEKLSRAIKNSDVKMITRAPGVGPKLAQRIILELKDKLIVNDINSEDDTSVEESSSSYHEALQALQSLGYTEKECAKVLKDIALDDSLENIIKNALKHLMG
ncbi:Holliday junction branch migration protein RuvA [Clostridium oryzae]|uniref:Holliday junction branch migration complex subunit RuvA n=1 Tax=Clostridium oryzae TaxID=1450648 RepID=A0A1V4IUW6_9CLOT|nr:Holliday junction branch migration protein RuvA [Clostridium oryzae]OPJ63574.1 holliday junction ATP-dependent DNA helicase RuvA [Clostridium oryzae]